MYLQSLNDGGLFHGGGGREEEQMNRWRWGSGLVHLSPLGLFQRTSIPRTWRILSACLSHTLSDSLAERTCIFFPLVHLIFSYYAEDCTVSCMSL